MTIADVARPEIRALLPYQAAVQLEDTVRLNANEAPWTNGIDHFHRPLNRYPEIRPARLRSRLAERFGCDANRLLVTRGTSEAIDLLIRSFCRAGVDNIVTVTPTFSMYAHYAVVQGASVREFQTKREQDFHFSSEDVLSVCDDNTRLIFICSPNNPTGTTVSRSTIIEILKRASGRAAVVIDEAYVEFSQQETLTHQMASFDNLIVLRTLSKALAFAGARCGAVMGPADVISMLSAVQAPYAMATPVVECVEAAFQSECLQQADQQVAEILDERTRLIAALANLNCVEKIWPSHANFFLMQIDNVKTLLEQAERDRVLLRYFGGNLSDCVRVTVGSSEENRQLIESINKVASSHG